ncbi:C-C motif chemokine 19a.1 [Aulostomus maculatus]
MTQKDEAKLHFYILFIACYCTVTLAQIGLPMDCCLDVTEKRVQKAAVAEYRQQISGQGCSITAMILVTRRNKVFCVDVDALWLQEVMKHVDHIRKECKRTNYKGKRCFGVRPEKTERRF